jgi:hypothetical protein
MNVLRTCHNIDVFSYHCGLQLFIRASTRTVQRLYPRYVTSNDYSLGCFHPARVHRQIGYCFLDMLRSLDDPQKERTSTTWAEGLPYSIGNLFDWSTKGMWVKVHNMVSLDKTNYSNGGNSAVTLQEAT